MSRARICSIFLEIVRTALLQGDYSDAILTSILCATWVCEIVEYLCAGEKEIQQTITSALSSSPAWSLCITLFRHVTVFSGTNSILQNILWFRLNVRKVSCRILPVPQNTVMNLLNNVMWADAAPSKEDLLPLITPLKSTTLGEVSYLTL